MRKRGTIVLKFLEEEQIDPQVINGIKEFRKAYAPETEAAAGFYREFGFSPAADGPAWEKFIGYDPEFLGT